MQFLRFDAFSEVKKEGRYKDDFIKKELYIETSRIRCLVGEKGEKRTFIILDCDEGFVVREDVTEILHKLRS